MFGGAGVLFVELAGDDRAALFPEQTVELRGDGLVVPSHGGKVGRIIGADAIAALGDQPIGQAAMTHLTMAPRSDAHGDEEARLGGEGDETPQVACIGPVGFSANLLVVDPENVGGNDADATGVEAAQGLGPRRGGQPREMQFAHDGQPTLTVAPETQRVHAEGGTRGRGGGAEVIDIRRRGGGRREGQGRHGAKGGRRKEKG